MSIYISIDDTDNKESFGTGKMARMLAQHLAEAGLINRPTITRHQFLVHRDIPYTSHNSCACIEADGTTDNLKRIFELSRDFLICHYHEEANPGLCVGEGRAVPDKIVEFGLKAQREVLSLKKAKEMAAELDLLTWWYGETGQGIIGALGGIGLRSRGMDGRFISLNGIRNIQGMMTVSEILAETPITKVVTKTGEVLAETEVVNTMHWIRPDLVDGAIILTVLTEEGEWRTIEKAKRKKKSKAE